MSTQMGLGCFLQQYETDKFSFFCSQDNGNNSYKEYIQNLKRKSHYVIHKPDEDDQQGGDVASREGLKVTRETMEVENGMAVGAGRPPLWARVE